MDLSNHKERKELPTSTPQWAYPRTYEDSFLADNESISMIIANNTTRLENMQWPSWSDSPVVRSPTPSSCAMSSRDMTIDEVVGSNEDDAVELEAEDDETLQAEAAAPKPKSKAGRKPGKPKQSKAEIKKKDREYKQKKKDELKNGPPELYEAHKAEHAAYATNWNKEKRAAESSKQKTNRLNLQNKRAAGRREDPEK